MRGISIVKPVIAFLFATGLAEVRAQIPEGFEVVQLANDLGIHSRPEINDRSEVVWSSSFPPDASDVWLYRDGVIRKISVPESYDINPSNNNLSAVSWRRCESYFAQDCQLIVHEDDLATHVETPHSVDQMPVINDANQIIWVHDFSGTFDNVALFLTNATEGDTVQLTTSEFSNQVPRLNSDADFAWNRIDFSVSPWVSWVMVSIDGQQIEITDGTGQPQWVDLNDSAAVVFRQRVGNLDMVRMWEAGSITTISQGGNPRINKHGDTSFGRWDDAAQIRYQTLSKDGVLYQLPSTLGWWSASNDINNIGEIAWREIDPVIGNTRIMLLQRIAYSGDFDGDCRISTEDVAVFFDCFTGPVGPPGELDPACAAGDFDQDQDVDFADFGAFHQAFTGPDTEIEQCVPLGSGR